MVSLRKDHPLLSLFNSSLIDLPSPTNISYYWNFGSLLGLCLGLQIITGIFLALHYMSSVGLAFYSVIHLMSDVDYGWVLRYIHLNGASVFFICLYIHIGRGIYYGGYSNLMTWSSGVIIFLLVMITAFLGYVLPWGQMSFWGATVITNLLSAFPYIGVDLVQWLWGGFSVDEPTLNRFFSFHFVLPFVLLAFVIIHLIFLHEVGSSNPLGVNSNVDSAPLYPYFIFSDLLGVAWVVVFLLLVSLLFPNFFSDPENFIMANPLVTPVHIQPEWYFLFAYAILRSIPNKLGGVICLILSVMVLLILPYLNKVYASHFSSLSSQIGFWIFVNIFILLTWIGARPVEEPYIIIGQSLSGLYFSFFLLKVLM